MDKRTLFFVAVMSIALFSINSFFSYMDKDRTKEWHQQQQQQKLTEKKELQAQLENSVAPLEDFPITKLYSDEAKENFLTFAFETDGTSSPLSLIKICRKKPLAKKALLKKQAAKASQYIALKMPVR